MHNATGRPWLLRNFSNRALIAAICLSLANGISVGTIDAQFQPAQLVVGNQSSTYLESEFCLTSVNSAAKLYGTLTTPVKIDRFPCIVLLSGSGEVDRDNVYGQNGPGNHFAVADGFARKGIAVFRYEKRGVGKSGGTYSESTLLDFADDAQSALVAVKAHLRDKISLIGFVGHSEGGLVASIVAARSKDVSFVVLMGTPGMTYEEFNIRFIKELHRVEGSDSAIPERSLQLKSRIIELVKTGKTDELTANRIRELWVEFGAADPDRSTSRMLSKGMRFLLAFDPVPVFGKLACPVLAINGNKDIMVQSKENLKAIKDAVIAGGNRNVTTFELDGLGHCFFKCNTGSLSEYKPPLSLTMAPAAVDVMTEWINRQVAPRSETIANPYLPPTPAGPPSSGGGFQGGITVYPRMNPSIIRRKV